MDIDLPPLPKVPRITLITACRNAEATIQRTLRSVDEQAGAFELEHLIQDGGSSDTTLGIVREYARTSRGRVLVASEPDSGFYDAINKGIKRATGDIIGLINADDWFAGSDVLQDIARSFLAEDAMAVIYADLDYVRLTPAKKKSDAGAGLQTSEKRVADQTYSESAKFSPPEHQIVRRWVAGRYGSRSFRNGWMPPHPTVYVRRELYERIGGYRLDLGSAADYEWIVRLFVKHGITAAYLPRVTVKMLTGGQSNRTLLARYRANRNDRKAWSLNGLKPFPWFPLTKPLLKLRQFF